MLVLVLHDFGLPGTLPFWDPWSFCHWARPCLGPQLVTFWFFIPVFRRRGRRLFGRGSNVRYVHLIELIFGFLMVFILYQSDIY